MVDVGEVSVTALFSGIEGIEHVESKDDEMLLVLMVQFLTVGRSVVFSGDTVLCHRVLGIGFFIGGEDLR